MPVSRDIVVHVARLAHVGLTPDEVDGFAHDLSSVIDHMAVLGRVSTDDVPATSSAVPLDTVLRVDEVRPSWPAADVLANAPHRADDQFEVQPILD